jgi:hypothetical protein
MVLRSVTNITQPEWIVFGNEDKPNPSAGYIISFAHFHEQGFGTLTSNFFRGLLHHYGNEM